MVRVNPWARNELSLRVHFPAPLSSMMTETHPTTSRNSDTQSTSRILVHDARDALAPILMGIEILRGRGVSEDQVAILEMMSNQVATLSDILNLKPAKYSELLGQPSHEGTIKGASIKSPAPAEPSSVLIIDDNPNIIAFLKTLFEDRDYTVFAAITAEDAVALASQVKPDVCLCDIGLPTVDGFAAASELLQAHPGMRIFSMSGLDDPGLSDPSRLQAAGFQAHFKKPIPFEEMIGIMEGYKS